VSIEVHAEQDPPLAVCCAHAPAMIHFDKAGNVIGSFDAPQGHGMGVDKQGFVYIGQNTVRKYDPKTGQVLAAIPHIPENANGQPFDNNPRIGWVKGRGSAGAVAGFITVPGAEGGRGRGGRGGGDGAATQAQLQQTAFVAKYPPTTPMIIGGIEEIRTDDAVNEIYVADNSFGGRVMVFSLDKFEFKRGWGAYGHKLSEISTKPEDHAYTPNGPMAKEFVGHFAAVGIPHAGNILKAQDDCHAFAAPFGEQSSQQVQLERKKSDDNSSRFTGVINDPMGAVIPGAEATLLAKSGAKLRFVQTDDNGNFSFEGLAAGVYTLKVNSPGFKTLTIKRLEIKATEAVRAQIVLNVVDSGVMVGIIVTSPDIESSNGTTIIKGDFIRKLPINN
jgi:hypothetical protein